MFWVSTKVARTVGTAGELDDEALAHEVGAIWMSTLAFRARRYDTAHGERDVWYKRADDMWTASDN